MHAENEDRDSWDKITSLGGLLTAMVEYFEDMQRQEQQEAEQKEQG
jgi:hypothetical protein